MFAASEPTSRSSPPPLKMSSTSEWTLSSCGAGSVVRQCRRGPQQRSLGWSLPGGRRPESSPSPPTTSMAPPPGRTPSSPGPMTRWASGDLMSRALSSPRPVEMTTGMSSRALTSSFPEPVRTRTELTWSRGQNTSSNSRIWHGATASMGWAKSSTLTASGWSRPNVDEAPVIGCGDFSTPPPNILTTVVSSGRLPLRSPQRQDRRPRHTRLRPSPDSGPPLALWSCRLHPIGALPSAW